MNTSLEWMGEVDQETPLTQTVSNPVSKPERQGLCSASLHLLNPDYLPSPAPSTRVHPLFSAPLPPSSPGHHPLLNQDLCKSFIMDPPGSNLAWWATVNRTAKSHRTKKLSMHTNTFKALCRLSRFSCVTCHNSLRPYGL